MSEREMPVYTANNGLKFRARYYCAHDAPGSHRHVSELLLQVWSESKTLCDVTFCQETAVKYDRYPDGCMRTRCKKHEEI